LTATLTSAEKNVDDEAFVVWMNLVPCDGLASKKRILKGFQQLGAGWHRTGSRRRCLTAYPADIGEEELTSLAGSPSRSILSTVGGGLMLKGHGTGVAFVADPPIDRPGRNSPTQFTG